MFRKYAAVLCCLFLFQGVASASVPDSLYRSSGGRVVFFGIIEKDAQGKESFVKTDRVPLQEGQAYGWMIRLARPAAKVKWKEVFTLPAAPETWGTLDQGASLNVSPDRKVFVTEKEEPPREGIISNFWSVAPGDPPGPHVIRVYINDVLVETFHFKMVEPSASGKSVQPD
jgi:hypothetical protein